MASILVIDDDDQLRSVLVRLFRPDHDVTTASDGHEAVAKIRSGQRFDVILSDVNMPRLDGIQVYWQLAEVAPDQAQRMVFMSGGDFDDSNCLPGVADNPWLRKPFSPARVRDLIAGLLALWE